MRDLRKLSARMARRDGLPFKKDFSKYFPEIYQYRPQMVPESVWPRLCDVRDTIYYCFILLIFITYYIIKYIFLLTALEHREMEKVVRCCSDEPEHP